MSKPYAPAREGVVDAAGRELMVMDHLEFLKTTHQLVRQMKRLKWRDMVAVRTSAISRAVRLCEASLAEKYVARTRERCAWIFWALVGTELVPVLRTQWEPLRRFTEAPLPIEIIVLSPGIVDVGALQSALAAPAKEGSK